MGGIRFLQKFGLGVIAWFLVNRISSLSYELFKVLIYYDYEFFEIKDKYVGEMVGLDDLVLYFVPLNPFFIGWWSPMMILNLLVLFVYWKGRSHLQGLREKISWYCLSMILGFLMAIAAFVLLSYINNFDSRVVGDQSFYKLFLESYAPYSPRMICGYLLGHSTFALVFVLIVEKYIERQGS